MAAALPTTTTNPDATGGAAIIRDALTTSGNLIRNDKALTFDYEPPTLVGREDEMRHLARAYRGLVESGTPTHVLITGPVGAGKTALARRFCRDLADVVHARRGKAVDHVLINCRQRVTATDALTQVIRHFDGGFPERGFSASEILDVLRKRLQRTSAHLIVILDEADVLLRNAGSDLVYHLTRFNAETPDARETVSVMLLSQNNPRDFLDDASHSTFRRTNTLTLEPYSEEGIGQIVRERAAEALRRGALPSDTRALIARLAAPKRDARYAIEMLEAAARAAMIHGRDTITTRDVQAARDGADRRRVDHLVADLPRHHALLLHAMTSAMERSGLDHTTTGETEAAYHETCAEHGEAPRTHTQVWTYMQKLTARGIINTRRSGKGVLGTTTIATLAGDLDAGLLKRSLEARL